MPHQFIRISIIDTGRGIKQQNHDKLFRLFGNMKDVKQSINTDGIGLGLVISKLIITKFKGEIDFTSEFGKGSCF